MKQEGAAETSATVPPASWPAHRDEHRAFVPWNYSAPWPSTHAGRSFPAFLDPATRLRIHHAADTAHSAADPWPFALVGAAQDLGLRAHSLPSTWSAATAAGARHYGAPWTVRPAGPSLVGPAHLGGGRERDTDSDAGFWPAAAPRRQPVATAAVYSQHDAGHAAAYAPPALPPTPPLAAAWAAPPPPHEGSSPSPPEADSDRIPARPGGGPADRDDPFHGDWPFW
jgi:hypothetical protein